MPRMVVVVAAATAASVTDHLDPKVTQPQKAGGTPVQEAEAPALQPEARKGGLRKPESLGEINKKIKKENT